MDLREINQKLNDYIAEKGGSIAAASRALGISTKTAYNARKYSKEPVRYYSKRRSPKMETIVMPDKATSSFMFFGPTEELLKVIRELR